MATLTFNANQLFSNSRGVTLWVMSLSRIVNVAIIIIVVVTDIIIVVVVVIVLIVATVVFVFFYLIPLSSYHLFRSLLRVWMRSGNDGIRL